MTPPPDPVGDNFPVVPASEEPTADERAEWKSEFTTQEQEAFGLRSVLEGGFAYCGVTIEEYAIGGVTYAWPTAIKKLRWSLNFSRLGKFSDMDFKDRATTWFKEISGCCDRHFEYTSNPRLANILYTVQRLDGASGVLADCQLPVGNVNGDTQLLCRFDDSEAWTDEGSGILIYPVGLHETEHAMGLGHKPANVNAAALISPRYDPNIRNLQAADIAELVRRYGKPTTVTPPPPTTPIEGMVFSYGDGEKRCAVTVDFPSERTVAVKIDVQKGGLKTTLSGSKPLSE